MLWGSAEVVNSVVVCFFLCAFVPVLFAPYICSFSLCKVSVGS